MAISMNGNVTVTGLEVGVGVGFKDNIDELNFAVMRYMCGAPGAKSKYRTREVQESQTRASTVLRNLTTT